MEPIKHKQMEIQSGEKCKNKTTLAHAHLLEALLTSSHFLTLVLREPYVEGSHATAPSHTCDRYSGIWILRRRP